MFTAISNILHPLFKKVSADQFSEEGFVKYFGNIQWTTVARVATMVFSLVTTIVSARILGPTPFGALSYAISIVGIFAIFSSLGVELSLFKELTEHKEEREKILGSALSLRLLTGILGCIGVIGMLLVMKEDPYIESIIFVLSFSLITQALPLLSYDFLKDAEAKYVAITQIATMIIANTLKILVVYLYHSILLFTAILVCEGVLAGALYAFQIVSIKKRSLRLSFSLEKIKLILSFSLPLVFFSAFTEIYARIDQIMLKHYLDLTAVGLYGVAVRLTELWYVIPNILIGALFPALINTHENKPEYKKRLTMLLIVLSSLSLAIIIPAFFLRELIITLIYGQAFISAAPLLGIYIFSLVGSFISYLIYQDLFLNKKTLLILAIPLVTALLNILLNMYLIPLKGAAGAAIATVISYNLIPVIYFLTVRTQKNHEQ